MVEGFYQGYIQKYFSNHVTMAPGNVMEFTKNSVPKLKCYNGDEKLCGMYESWHKMELPRRSIVKTYTNYCVLLQDTIF